MAYERRAGRGIALRSAALGSAGGRGHLIHAVGLVQHPVQAHIPAVHHAVPRRSGEQRSLRAQGYCPDQV